MRALLGVFLAIVLAIAMTPIVPAGNAYAYVDAGQEVTDNATQFKFYTMLPSTGSVYGDVVYTSDLAGEHPIAAAAAGEIVYLHVTPSQGYKLADSYDCIRVAFAGKQEITLDPHLDSPIVKDATNVFHFTMPDCYALLGANAERQAAAGGIYAVLTPTFIPRTDSPNAIVGSPGAGGTITGLPESAYAEDVVTFTPQPNTNYQVDEVYVTIVDTTSSYNIDCEASANGSYSFTMPASESSYTAVVHVSFKEASSPQLTSVNPPTPATLTYNGVAQIGLAGGTGYELSLAENASPAATFSDGNALGTNAGTYNVMATLSSGYAWNDGTTTAKMIPFVISPVDIQVCTTTLAATYTVEQATTAASQNPQLTYTTPDGTPLAVPSGDFTVSYATNDGEPLNGFPTEPGTYTATFAAGNTSHASGNYVNTKVVTFQVTETPAQTYTVTCQTPTHGTLSATPTVGIEGTPIRVTPSADPEYSVASVSYAYGGHTYPVDLDGSGAYTFELPASNVTVTATFEAVPPGERAIPLPSAQQLTYNGSYQVGISASEGYTLDIGGLNLQATGSSGAKIDERGNFTVLNAGEYVASVTLKDGFTWSGATGDDARMPREIPVVVNPKNIATCTLAPIATQTTTGSAVQPTLSITDPQLGALSEDDYTATYANNVQPGTATISVAGKGNYTGSLSGSFTLVAASEEPEVVSMHRLYNPNSGEHFYTADPAEAEAVAAAGWSYEGIGWTAPTSSNTPVYRLYDAVAGEHFYTTSEADRDAYIAAGCNDEGIGWYSDDAQGIEVLCQVNPNAEVGAFNFTINQAENDHLMQVGWSAGASIWYALAN